MSEIKLRFIDGDIKAKLEVEAKKHNLSLNKYICNILTDYALNPSIRNTENKYEILAKDMITLYQKTIEEQSEIINENNYILRKVERMLKERGI